jgi:hypothetical protein
MLTIDFKNPSVNERQVVLHEPASVIRRGGLPSRVSATLGGRILL